MSAHGTLAEGPVSAYKSAKQPVSFQDSLRACLRAATGWKADISHSRRNLERRLLLIELCLSGCTFFLRAFHSRAVWFANRSRPRSDTFAVLLIGKLRNKSTVFLLRLAIGAAGELFEFLPVANYDDAPLRADSTHAFE